MTVALHSEGGGHTFESCRARHSPCEIGSFPHIVLVISVARRPAVSAAVTPAAPCARQYLGPAPLHSPLKGKARSSFVSIERHADARSAPPDYSTLRASAARFYFQLEGIRKVQGSRNFEAGACVRQVSDNATYHGRSLIENDLPRQQRAATASGATLRHNQHQTTPQAVVAAPRLASTATFAIPVSRGRLLASILKTRAPGIAHSQYFNVETPSARFGRAGQRPKIRPSSSRLPI